MSKYDYFGTLDSLSRLSEQAVQTACSSPHRKSADPPSELRRACDKTVCGLEDALFSDFLPPMERETLAACAHSLSRVVNEATELISATPKDGFDNEEGELCVRLASLLRDTVGMLQKISKPSILPRTQAFRGLITEAREAHEHMLSRVRSGALPRTAATAIIQTGRLRNTLSEAFDCVVEVMLGNI